MPTIDYDRVKTECDTLDYLAAMGWRPARTGGLWVRGACPRHAPGSVVGDTFHVHKLQGYWHCHKCRAGGTVLDLSRWLKRLTLREAALDVCATLGVAVPYVARSRANRRPRT